MLIQLGLLLTRLWTTDGNTCAQLRVPELLDGQELSRVLTALWPSFEFRPHERSLMVCGGAPKLQRDRASIRAMLACGGSAEENREWVEVIPLRYQSPGALIAKMKPKLPSDLRLISDLTTSSIVAVGPNTPENRRRLARLSARLRLWDQPP